MPALDSSAPTARKRTPMTGGSFGLTERARRCFCGRGWRVGDAAYAGPTTDVCTARAAARARVWASRRNAQRRRHWRAALQLPRPRLQVLSPPPLPLSLASFLPRVAQDLRGNSACRESRRRGRGEGGGRRTASSPATNPPPPQCGEEGATNLTGRDGAASEG